MLRGAGTRDSSNPGFKAENGKKFPIARRFIKMLHSYWAFVVFDEYFAQLDVVPFFGPIYHLNNFELLVFPYIFVVHTFYFFDIDFLKIRSMFENFIREQKGREHCPLTFSLILVVIIL